MPIAPLAENLEMYYDDDNFTDPWRDPATVETIVLHHGNAKNGRLWYAWPPLLARQYRVIRVDARGFGRSTVPAPDSYDWSLEGFAGDLRNLLDYLEVDKAHLIGETIGGTIALQFAYQYPERLHTVTTCTSPYNFTGVDTYQNYYRLVQEEGTEGWARATGGRRVSADAAPEHHEWYIQQMGQTARHVVLETLAYLGTQNLTDRLPSIQTPALAMVGELSEGDIPDRAQGQADLMPNCTLARIPGAGGYVQHSAPAQCVLAWQEFVGTVHQPG